MREPRGCEPEDKFIREYTKDTSWFVHCEVFEDKNGKEYTICTDQDGEDWIEE